MRSAVASVTVVDTPERIAAFLLAEEDVRDAGSVMVVTTVAVGPGDQPDVVVELADGD